MKTKSLRGLLGALVLMLAVLTAAACAGLILLTTALHRTTEGATIAVESVRLAEEAQIDLLLHEQAKDPLVREQLESDLQRRLEGARRFVTSAAERQVFDEAFEGVQAYLALAGTVDAVASEVTARHVAAFGAIDALVEINVADARLAQETATSWDRLGNIVGIGVGAIVLLMAVTTLLWLQHRAFEPIGHLAAAMQRFAEGDGNARAPEEGATELREISRRYNEMASALAAQRRLQIAFLGGVAHDLRNPLSVLKMSTSMVRPDRLLPPEPVLRNMIATMRRQISGLERMVADFLDMSSIEAGQLELKTAAHDLREIVSSVVVLFASSERTIETRLPEDPVVVRCDSLRIEQVLANLISNAIKYSPVGKPITVSLELRDGDVALSVADRGVGISREDRSRVFEPFRRVGLSKEAVPGVGLGLFVVRRIVEAHAGRVEIESEPGKGSTFRAVLPADQAA